MVGPWVGLTSRSPPTPTQEKVKERRERIMVEFEKMGLFLMEEKQRLLQAEDPGAHGSYSVLGVKTIQVVVFTRKVSGEGEGGSL